MHKKLTITVDEEVYNGLKTKVGPRKISQFIEELVRPHVLDQELENAYAEMAADEQRESEAESWIEGTFEDFENESR